MKKYVDKDKLQEYTTKLTSSPFIKKEYVTPEMFGAVGDGITNDATAIQAAIDTGLPVYFSKKSYKINSTITITKPIILIGSTSQRLETGRCNLDFSSVTGNAIVIGVQGVTIEDLNFLGDRTNTICFDIENFYKLTLNRCGIFKFNKGIYTNRAWNIGINNCIFEFCNTCIEMNGTNTSWSIVGTNFYWSTYGIVSNTELDYSALYACGFDSCDTCIQLGHSNADALALIGCGFENYIIGVYCMGNAYCTLINPLFLNTERSVETYKGFGQIVVIGGRTDWELTPNKSDVIHVGTWMNDNAHVMANVVSFNERYMMPIKMGQVCDYVWPISNGYTMHINYENNTMFDVEINTCTTDYPETVHFTKESSTIAKTQGTFNTFTYVIDHDNNKIDITFTKGGNIRVRGWFKYGGSIT